MTSIGLKAGPGLRYAAFFILIFYLVIGTGIISDDYNYTVTLKGKNFSSALSPAYCIGTPLEIYTHFIWYYFLPVDRTVYFDLIKILYLILSFYLISKFFGIFMDETRALLASFLFIFFPTHDSTVYWFLGQYLTLSAAFYLYAYYLAHKNKFLAAILAATAASFISYGSPVLAITLGLLFFLNRQFKKGMTLLIPNVVYSCYYIGVSAVFGYGAQRLPSRLDFGALAGQLTLQIATFADAMCGPSFWLKIYYSFFQLSKISIFLGVAITAILYKRYKKAGVSYDLKLLTALIVLAAGSLLMFALTGAYPQLAFNLGNRTTIFGSLLFTYLIVMLSAPRILKIAVLAVLFFSILGISDHWKAFNIERRTIARNIMNNADWKTHEGFLYVTGNQYSSFGRLGHIELFTEEGGPALLFWMYSDGKVNAKPLNKRHTYKDGYLIDTKYGERMKVDREIGVYDSEKNLFL
ncbi:MAG: hypothetical protein Q7S07_04535, partial [Candidatus Omnitrophota bacterium]|nr:hypothetical protein [Candidatus Omnitrophota bacterium]